MLLDVLLFPITVPLKGAIWVVRQLEERALAQFYDPEVLRAELIRLRISYERDAISQEEYRKKSEEIWERLKLATANDREDNDDGDSTD
jgi:hypothetical protein